MAKLTESYLRSMIKQVMKESEMKQNQSQINISEYSITQIGDTSTFDITFDVYKDGKKIEPIEQSFNSYAISTAADEVIKEILLNNLHIAYQTNLDLEEEEALKIMLDSVTFNKKNFARDLMQVKQRDGYHQDGDGDDYYMQEARKRKLAPRRR